MFFSKGGPCSKHIILSVLSFSNPKVIYLFKKLSNSKGMVFLKFFLNGVCSIIINIKGDKKFSSSKIVLLYKNFRNSIE